MDVDWVKVFSLSQPWAETVVRGSCIYWFLFLMFRVVVRRDIGSVGIADVLVVVIIADAAQNGMSGDYKSVTDAFILIGTIIFWNVGLNWLSFHYPRIARLAEPAPLLVIENGRILRRNMRREFLTEEELRGQLRANGVEQLDEVEHAYIESDGTISVIKRDR